MRKTRIFLYAYAIIALCVTLVCAFLVCAFLVYGIWYTNAPARVKILFPEETQFLRETDTHQGFFRRRGIAMTVAQIPTEQRYAFEAYLAGEGFWNSYPYDEARQKLELIPEAESALKEECVLWTYQDEALALIEEAFSDFFAAVYDLETGIFYCVEYDE